MQRDLNGDVPLKVIKPLKKNKSHLKKRGMTIQISPVSNRRHSKMHIGSFFQKSLHILECLLFGAGEI